MAYINFYYTLADKERVGLCFFSVLWETTMESAHFALLAGGLSDHTFVSMIVGQCEVYFFVGRQYCWSLFMMSFLLLYYLFCSWVFGVFQKLLSV